MKTFKTLEDQVYDIIRCKSRIEMAWVGTNHIAKLCHILGWRTSIDEVEMILGKLLWEKRVQMKHDNRLGEIFHIA